MPLPIVTPFTEIDDILVDGNESYSGEDIRKCLEAKGYVITRVDALDDSNLREFRLQALKLATSANTTSDKSDGSTTLARAKLFFDFMLGTSTDTKAG